ncbi:MAG: enoyl-CoA hydratase-related protein [Acidimicrobiia bacterium]|nr:MAG: enoyl-CoA hydratase-related protein [Acidimicrobiia bacterium]
MIRSEASGGRATITIDDPERRNPLSNAAMAEMAAAIHEVCADDAVRVIVITGAGEDVFSAGGDLSGGFVDAPLAGHGDRAALPELFRAMRRCDQPVVARVNGHAYGGGLGLVAASDLAICAEHARLGTPEITVGLWPMVITAVLKPLVPRRALFEMMLTGRRFDAAEAQRLGLVNRVAAADELDAAVDDLVEQLSANSPAVMALGKRAFYAVEDMDLDTALDYLHHGLTAVASTEDAAEGIEAFLDKRPPEWRGR